MESFITRARAKAVLELLQRIDENYVPSEAELLDLSEIREVCFSNLGLASLPKSIGKLSQLTQLDISDNQLTSLPECIGNLSQLSVLNVSFNQLTSLPECIGDLSQLFQLNVFDNQLTSLPECIGDLSQLSELNVSFNQLTSLPECIGDLSQLSGLKVSRNRLTSLPECIGNLSQLSELDVSRNQLTSLPECIGNLSQLSELDVSGNQLTSLPECIGNLLQLSQLDISFNQLTSLPESIGDLLQLSQLDISFNRLTSLPECIGDFSQLSELDVSLNQLTSLPERIGALSQLSKLNVSCNQLTSLPECIGDLSQLTFLSLQRLGIQTLPHWLRQLSMLEHLDLSRNPLQALPDWLGNMTTLRDLSLAGLRLTELPRSLLKLNLPFFADSRTWIDNQCFGINIGNTELSIQPVSLFDQSRDKSPNFQESRKLIEDYFDTSKIPIREAKVIFLGDGKVGKTYTIQRLLHDCRKGDYPTKETHGILIEDLLTEKDGQSYKVRVWDFGGQDIMHEMHRCFLTDRTCYVVMVDTRSDKQTGRARYWLRTVQSIAPQAPVLLLVNEVSGGKNRDLDYSSLEREFPNLVGVSYCSAKDASDEDFREKVGRAIFEQSLNLDSCKMYLPESWEKVRQNLLLLRGSTGSEQEKVYYIDRQTFHVLCDQYGVPADDGLRAWLLTWFNDLGVCFSYHLGEDGQEQSVDYKILDPMWLTSAVYKIIWEKARTDDGLISLSEIYRILEKPGSEAMKKDGIPCLEDVSYDQNECRYVLDIMRMFCISYPADASTEFIPTLCNPDSKLDPTPQTWKQHAAYRFHYTFLPESVLHRLMIYCFANLRPGKRWRKGFWLECEPQGLSAVIRTTGQNSEENELQIDVYAQNEQYEAWIWLQPLCQQIITINSMLSLKAEVFVLAENDQEEKWFSLDSVWYWKKQGEATLQGERSRFAVQSLLTLIYGKHYPDVERRLMDRLDKRRYPIPSEELPQTVTAGIAEGIGLDLSKPFSEQIIKAWDRMNNLLEQGISAIKGQTIATQENTKAEQVNTAALRQNTLTLQQTNELLQAIRDGKVALPSEVITALAEAFRESEEPALKATGQKMKWCFWKDKGQLLRDLLGDAANLATVVPVLLQLGKTYGPILLELLEPLIPV